jgi:SAM-dependent methyltransferase
MSVSRETPPSCDYEGSAYRTEFWEASRDYEDTVERIALRALLPPTGERLMEIGAGFGRLAEEYAGYRQVILLDPARSMLEEAQAHLGHDPRFVFAVGSVYDLPLATTSCDTVVTVRVLHHLAEVPLALDEIARVTRPGGAYVLEYANKRHLKAIMRYLLRLQSHDPFSLEPYEFENLNFDFHPAYMAAALHEAGFQVEARRAVSIFRLGFLKRTIPTRLLAGVDGWLQRPLASLTPAPSVFLRTRPTRPGPATIAPHLFRCRQCHQEGTLQPGDESLTLRCTACGARWSIRDGIHDFREPLQ